MIKLSLNKAAKEAGIAKSTLLDAIRSGRMSAPKNEKGHYDIDPSELFRVFPKTSSTKTEEPISNEHKNSKENSALAVEVKMLREQINLMQDNGERERSHLEKQITNLQEQLERQSADHRQALAVLQDQRPQAEEKRKGFFKRMVG